MDELAIGLLLRGSTRYEAWLCSVPRGAWIVDKADVKCVTSIIVEVRE